MPVKYTIYTVKLGLNRPVLGLVMVITVRVMLDMGTIGSYVLS